MNSLCDECQKEMPTRSQKLSGAYMEWEIKKGENEAGGSIVDELRFSTDRELCDKCFNEAALHVMRNAMAGLEGGE